MGSFFRKEPRGNYNGIGGNSCTRGCTSRPQSTVKPAYYVFQNDQIYLQIYTSYLLIVDTNDDVLNIEAGKINKFAHITFGNISDTYKIIQINTGNGLWTSNDMLLLCCITKEDPDIVIISESNFNINNPKMAQRRRNLFSGFQFFNRLTMPNLP